MQGFYTSGIQYLDLSATPDYPLLFSGSVFLRNAILVILGYVIFKRDVAIDGQFLPLPVLVGFYPCWWAGCFCLPFHHCSNHHRRLYHRSFHRPFHHLTHHLFCPWLVAFLPPPNPLKLSIIAKSKYYTRAKCLVQLTGRGPQIQRPSFLVFKLDLHVVFGLKVNSINGLNSSLINTAGISILEK